VTSCIGIMSCHTRSGWPSWGNDRRGDFGCSGNRQFGLHHWKYAGNGAGAARAGIDPCRLLVNSFESATDMAACTKKRDYLHCAAALQTVRTEPDSRIGQSALASPKNRETIAPAAVTAIARGQRSVGCRKIR